MADKRIPELLKIPARWHGLSCEPLLSAVDLSKWIPKIISWQIIGGESGQHARPCNIGWVRSIVEQGNAGGLATFVKQLGANAVQVNGCFSSDFGPDHDAAVAATNPTPVGLADKKGGDMSEWPKDLRVREFPKGF